MVCQLQPECNFLHRYFKCKLPIEVVDVEVKVTFYAGDPIVQKRSDHAGNQMCTVDKQHTSTPHHHKENENLFGGGEQNGNDHPNIHKEQTI